MTTLIAVPVFNERPYVARVLDRLREIHPHLLFVDDCSTDGTSEFLAKQTGIDVIRHAVNRGYGQGVIDSFDFAAKNKYDWVITIDCDEQHEPEMIPHFLAEIAKDDADVISGTRYTAASNADDIAPGDRRLINLTITNVLNDLFGWSLTDSFCGFKAHRVASMQALKLDEAGYAFPLQLWPRVYSQNLRLRELPVRRIYNDMTRKFGGGLDDAERRLKHYLSVLKRELILARHPKADCIDDVTLGEFSAAGCS